MKAMTIRLDTVDKVKQFVKVLTESGLDGDLTQGRYIVDASSIMGIFALNLCDVMTLSLASSDDSDYTRFAEFAA